MAITTKVGKKWITHFCQKLHYLQDVCLIQNLLRVSSRKNLNLSLRIFHSASKTIRGRLVSYFSEQISVQGTNDIIIPLDRQQLADYLGVERTALSKDHGKIVSVSIHSRQKRMYTVQ